MTELENPMVDSEYDPFDDLFGPSCLARYPERWCVDVRVSPRYL